MTANAALAAVTAKPKKAKAARPKPIKSADQIVRRQSRVDELSTSTVLEAFDRNGNTSLRTFGRVLRDEPHKNLYPIKLFLFKNRIPAKEVNEWCALRYAQATGGRNHGARYEVRSYKGDGGRYADYILLESMSEEELVLFTLQFGAVTNDKVVRNGKLRRPRLNKEQKKMFDRIVDDFYLSIERERAARANGTLIEVN